MGFVSQWHRGSSACCIMGYVRKATWQAQVPGLNIKKSICTSASFLNPSQNPEFVYTEVCVSKIHLPHCTNLCKISISFQLKVSKLLHNHKLNMQKLLFKVLNVFFKAHLLICFLTALILSGHDANKAQESMCQGKIASASSNILALITCWLQSQKDGKEIIEEKEIQSKVPAHHLPHMMKYKDMKNVFLEK